MTSKLNNINNKIHTSRTLSSYVKYQFLATFSPLEFPLSFLSFPLKNPPSYLFPFSFLSFSVHSVFLKTSQTSLHSCFFLLSFLSL